MNLHRAKDKADWELVKNADENVWQRLAASSHGIVTPGNFVTLAGLILVIIGLIAMTQQRYHQGAVELILGRLCDLVDGWLAEHTGTKNPLGELLDAGVDKVTSAAIILTLLGNSLVSWWILLIMAIPHLTIAAISLRTTFRHSRLHPSRVGKLSMATTWVSLISFVIYYGLHGRAAHIASIIAYVFFAISVILGIFAASGYLRQEA